MLAHADAHDAERARKTGRTTTFEEQSRRRSVERWGFTAAQTADNERSTSVEDVLDAYRVHTDNEHVENAPWYIIRPTSTFMSVWDGVTSAALIFTALVTPFEVAFLEPATSATEGLFIINRLIDGVFIFDMGIQFCIMYKVGNEENGASVRSLWEWRLPYIAGHYLRSWFCLDVCSIFPSAFDIMPMLSNSGTGDGSSSLKVFRVIRTARLGAPTADRTRDLYSAPCPILAVLTEDTTLDPRCTQSSSCGSSVARA